MNLEFNDELESNPNLSCARDLMNEAFIESFDEELDEAFKSLSIGPDFDAISFSNNSKREDTEDGKQIASEEPTETPELFEPISQRKPSFPCHFEFPNCATLDNSCLSETNKFPILRLSSEICTRFSPLEDISNIKLKQSSNNAALSPFTSNAVFATSSKLGDIRIPQHSKENFRALPSFSKIRSTMTDDLLFKGRKEAKQPFEELKCTSKMQITNAQLRKQIPVLIRKTGNKSPILKPKKSNLKSKPQTSGSSNEKVIIKAMPGSKCLTPNSNAKSFVNRRSLQHENRLQVGLSTEKNRRKSVSTLTRKLKDTDLTLEGKISGKEIIHGKDTSDFEKSCANATPVQPNKESSVGKCSAILSDAQNKRIDALAKEPGILEVTDLTLCANTVLFSRIFEDTFEFPKKIETTSKCNF